jgi:hypothetical protein
MIGSDIWKDDDVSDLSLSTEVYMSTEEYITLEAEISKQ